MRYAALLTLILIAPAADAQNKSSVQPIVTIEINADSVVVGQPAILRLKVLVPSYMPEPPVFPSLEQENLLVRLPERASGPISETVSGETWSGIQRSYRLYPMTSGQIDFDAANVQVTFADPDTNDPIQVVVPLPPVSLTATVPDKARGLDPLIIANGFEIQQQFDGNTELQVGDAISRTVTANIEGTSPIMIPPLLSVTSKEMLKAYPKEPRFNESEDRGILSGQRTDRVTYVAQDGGQSGLPEISIDWFNLKTGKVETAKVDQIPLVLIPPPWQMPDQEVLVRITLIFAVLIGSIVLILRKLRPIVRERLNEKNRRYLASPQFAYKSLKQAVSDRDLAGVYSALEKWKVLTACSVDTVEFEAGLAQIGASRYRGNSGRAREDWENLRAVLDGLDRQKKIPPTRLPPLNP
ncbi:MAG: hypothetical protein ACWA49_10015 [Ruegeria sp.]